MKRNRQNSSFKKIFDRHFFSNHHIEAQELEKCIEKSFKGYEAVTFSSLTGLICAIIDEIITLEIQLSFIDKDSKYESINKFLKETRNINDRLRKLDDLYLQQKVNITLGNKSMFGKVVLHEGSNLIGILLDFGKLNKIIASAPVFISKNKAFCEKVRWSRSSYGRRKPSEKINISSNGRFSELQAEVINKCFNNLNG